MVRIVISEKPGAGALARAETAGIPTAVVPFAHYPDRESFSAAVAQAAAAAGAEAMVLAGFMRVLTGEAIDAFPERILNVHPSLLPAFPGTRAVAQAIEYGVKVTGVTVHFVDEQVDHGPIVAQRPVPVLPGDTVETLHARIQTEEHDLYPQTVRALAEGRLSIEGRRVVWK